MALAGPPTAEDIAREGIHLLLDSTAQVIDAANHVVSIRDEAGKTRHLPYDRLVIATGAVPVRPRILGIDLPGVFLLRWVEDSFAVHEYLDTHAPRSAVIVGGGYIGVEMADAFRSRDQDELFHKLVAPFVGLTNNLK